MTQTIDRRTLARGTAWALPMIGVGALAPVHAASQAPQPGLQGWVNVNKQCGASTDRLTWDSNPGTPKPNDPFVPEAWGLWVYNTESTWTITEASITVLVPTTIHVNGVYSLAGNSGWSAPVAVASDIPGTDAY